MNEVLLNRIATSSQLPTLPVIAIKVLELTRRDDVSVPELATLIMNDPALASKILKTVNSPFYGLTKQVSTVSNALVILGLQAVKTLALGFSLLSNLQRSEKGSANFDSTLFWKRSIYAATASRVLAKKTSVLQQEEAFLAGLMANMGSLVLHRVVGDQFDPLLAQSNGDSARLNALCQSSLQLDPPAVSALLAEKWQFPPLLSRPIALQYSRDESDPEIKPLVEAVSAGVLLADVFVAADPAPAIAQARKELAARFDLTPEEIEALLEEIGKSARDAAKLMDMQVGKQREYQEILEEAQDAIMNLTLQSQHQVQAIGKEVAALQVKAATDPLTGMANRARFDEFFEEQFRRAFAQARPLALLMMDIDHFKKVNDTYGHQAGDEILRRTARVLRNSIRNIDLAARYGGEEFALVLLETDSAAAAHRAEAIRTAIAAEKLTFEGQAIRITISIGVAGTDRTQIFAQRDQLTNAADRALYAAKHAGRNAVRVFRPQAKTGVAAAPVAAALAGGK